jgi:hypothetical protein
MPNSQVDVTAGAPNLESYTDNEDGTVTDNVTGLMWQQASPLSGYAWADAVAYCSTLTLAGHSDWRLPTLIELYSIVDIGQPTMLQAISTYFSSGDLIWSSSSGGGSPPTAMILASDGSLAGMDVYDMYSVLCVR